MSFTKIGGYLIGLGYMVKALCESPTVTATCVAGSTATLCTICFIAKLLMSVGFPTFAVGVRNAIEKNGKGL